MPTKSAGAVDYRLRSYYARTSPLGKLRAEASVQVFVGGRPPKSRRPGADDDGDRRNGHVVRIKGKS